MLFIRIARTGVTVIIMVILIVIMTFMVTMIVILVALPALLFLEIFRDFLGNVHQTRLFLHKPFQGLPPNHVVGTRLAVRLEDSRAFIHLDLHVLEHDQLGHG